MLFEQMPGGFGAGFGDGEGGFGGGLVGREGVEEAGGPGDGRRTVETEDAGVAGSKEFGFTGAELGAKAEQEGGGVGADLLDGTGGVDLDGKLLVGEERSEVGEDVAARKGAAVNEGERAKAAEGAGGVGGATPYGLKLDVAHAGKEQGFVLVVEGGEGLGKGIFRPALRVGFGAVGFEEAREGGGQVIGQRLVLVQGGELGGFGDNKVVSVRDSLADGGEGGGRVGVAEGLERGEFGIETAAGGHGTRIQS